MLQLAVTKEQIDTAKRVIGSVERIDQQIKWLEESLIELKPLVQKYERLEYFKRELEEIKDKIIEEQQNSLPF